MELTKEQIQEIEKFLDKKGVDLIDFRVEIFDHIASEIEKYMNDKNDFDIVFNQVTKKWNEELNSTSSFKLGLTYNAPKIVIKKAEKIYKNYNMRMLFFSLPFFIMMFINLELYKEFFGKINEYTTMISGVLFCFTIYILLKSKESNIKTVYSFLIKTQSLFTLLLLAIFIISFFNIHFLELNILCIFNSFYLFFLFRKDISEKNKYKLIVQ